MKGVKRNVCIASVVTRMQLKKLDMGSAIQEAFERNEIDLETITPNEITELCGDIESVLNGSWPKQDSVKQLDLFM